MERELEDNYQKNSRPSEEVRGELEVMVGEYWRDGRGLPGRKEIGTIAKREETKKEESPPTQEECNEAGGMVEQGSRENIGVEDEKEVQESSVQRKENTNKGQKAEDKGKEEDIKEVMNGGKKAEDKGKEEDVEEISKAGEGWDRNVLISEERRGEGGAPRKSGAGLL